MIFDRTFWFVEWLISAAIIVVVALMVIRLIVDAADLNPFGWLSRTIRSLTDDLLMPVRGRLRHVGVDPKFAPILVILVAILLGFFVLQLVGAISTTLLGVFDSLQRGAFIRVVGFILYGLLSIYSLLIIVRIIFSWGMVSYTNRLMRFLVDVTEPILGPLRRVIPPLGSFDISPIVAFLIIWLFQAAVAGTLLRGAVIRGF